MTIHLLDGPDNLKGVELTSSAVNPTTPGETKYESVHVELAALRQRLKEVSDQRDEAWIEVAQLKAEVKQCRSVMAHYNTLPHTEYPKHAMPERGEPAQRPFSRPDKNGVATPSYMGQPLIPCPQY